MLWIIVFVIFVVILFIWLGVIFYQRRVSQKIDFLEQEKNKLLDPNLEEDFLKLNQANPSGESLMNLNSLERTYERLKNRKLVDLETFFFEAEDANNKFQFLQGNKKVSNLENKLNEIKSEITKIKKSLKKIKDVQQSDKKLVDVINTGLTEAKRQILAKSYAYGPAQDNLEHRVAHIDESFDNAHQIYLSGDYSKAKVLFDTIQQELSDLDKDMQGIEASYDQLSKIFPEQIAEIKDSYTKMKDSGYRFIDDDFDNQILNLENLIDQTIQLLTQAAIKDVKNNCQEIVKEIDDLYTILEREYKSRHNVQKIKDEIYQFIVHADRQNRTLSETVFEASNHFVLRRDENKKVSDFGILIEDIRLNYNRDLQKAIDKEAVYSVVFRDLELWRKQLKEIEKKQIQIAKNITENYVEVKQIKQSLLADDSALKVIARYIEKENLPGVPKDYEEFYIMVSKELNKAKKIVTEKVIDVEELDKTVRLLEEDLPTLADKTKEVVKNSRLTEILIQNSIQYQKDNPEITKAIEQAQKVYSQQYDYEETVNILAKQLELIKPGSFQDLVNNYNDRGKLKIQLSERS